MNVDVNRPIAARATPGQWAAGIAGLVAAVVAAFAFLNDARTMAKQALDLAQKAVDATGATQTKVDSALMDLAGKLGRIEGLLEAIRDERKGTAK